MENEDTKVVAPETDNGENAETQEDVLTVPKAEYEKLNQTLGSLKRELKDLKKPKEDSKESPKPDDSLLQKAYLRTANITAEDEVELALETAKKWDLPIDKLVDDEDFKIKLEKLRITKANTEATSNVRGSGNQSTAKNDPAYWIAKGTPPTPDQIPDRKVRSKIVRAFMESSKEGKKFYND
jgi:hypothetical protein